MRRMILAGLMILFPVMAGAQGWFTPERGSALRADLMDALRPMVEWELGAPVEFVIHDLRVAGDRAFAMLEAQRPGGQPINMWATPMVQRGTFDPELIDTPHIEVFWRKSGRMWVAVHWAIGATDVWYQYEPICAEYGALIPEVCAGLYR